ncbi:MAG: NAD-dependent epimerase/dehydratase family protein [Crocinitomicaceae bacterium]
MVFVTGATGLLGSHLLIELLSRGEEIKALKRTTSNLDQVKSVFKFYLGEKSDVEFDKIKWVDGDVLDITSLIDGMNGCSKVYHCAAMVSFVKKDFKKMMKINKTGTANVVNVCLGEKIDQLVYVSSTAAIGRDASKEFYTEENKWVNSPDNSNYAVTKYSAENEVWRGVEEGLNAVIVNPCVILGPGNWNESSLSIFKVVKKGLKFYTPGLNAFVDARDVAYAMAELSERRIENERFLVTSENLFFKDLFEKIAAAFKVKAPSIKVKPWLAGLAWRIEGLLHFLFGKKQNITKETARSSMKITKYSSQKLIDRIGIKFYSIDDSVKNAVDYFELKN